MKYYWILLCVVLLFSSCETSKYIFDDEILRIEIDIKNCKKIEQEIYKLKGSVKVQNLTEDVFLFDLNKLNLKLSSESSYGVYIDSIASRLVKVVKIEPYETYKENLYWIIKTNSKVEVEGIYYSITD